MATFKTQNTIFNTPIDSRSSSSSLEIQSIPYPYSVSFPSDVSPSAAIEQRLSQEKHPLIFADSNVSAIYFGNTSHFSSAAKLIIPATEETKNIYSAINLAEFLEQNKATKASRLYVIGGGIIQDIGAFAAAMYKRGIPWTLVPTTLLSQGDSCIGGKTGLNHKSTKNLIALFAAPRDVVIHTGFLETLSAEDILSGLGEIFRLHITGGPEFFEIFKKNFRRWSRGDKAAMTDLISGSLTVKRAVVEKDEFEIDLRRSMNYGHSLGHAIESLVNYAIPHGIGITLGVLIENEISVRRGVLSERERDEILTVGRHLVPSSARKLLQTMELDGVIEVLRKDKKTMGSILKLATITSVGHIQFIDLALEDATVELLRSCISAVLKALHNE